MTQNMILPSEVETAIEMFRSIGKGDFLVDLARKLQSAVKATMIDEVNTSLNIRLEFRRVKGEDMITIAGSTKANIPEPKKSTHFFVNDRTYLPTRRQPDQQTLI